jgi:cytoskeleton protein RodZ
MAKNLWKLDRRGDEDQPSAEPAEPVSQETDFEPVGDTLRARREERGEDLRYVAQILRIRYPYLKAIEDSLIDELPGPTYAIGFVRTYGEHLGLDSHDLVTRFKAEVDGLNARSDLHFPAPIPEGGVPSGAVLIVAVVMAFGIFGTWSYLSAPDDTVAEVVPAIPADGSDTASAGAEPAAGVAGTESKTADSTDKAAPTPTQQASKIDPAEVKENDPPAAVAVAPEPVSKKSEAAPLAATPNIAASLARARARAAPDPAPDPVVEPAAPEQQTETPAPNAVAAIQPSDQSLSESDNSAARTPKNYGASQDGNRIMVEAVADSWVEIRDKRTDELLLTRVLFKGDRYFVPNRDGLSLLTGNAGGLRIFVDGESTPAIGPIGSVRRDVPLEPDKLKGGVAGSGGGAATVDSPVESSPQ